MYSGWQEGRMEKPRPKPSPAGRPSWRTCYQVGSDMAWGVVIVVMLLVLALSKCIF